MDGEGESESEQEKTTDVREQRGPVASQGAGVRIGPHLTGSPSVPVACLHLIRNLSTETELILFSCFK